MYTIIRKKNQEKKLFCQFLLRKSSMQGWGIFATIAFQICLPWGIFSWKWLIVMSISQDQLRYLSNVNSVIYVFLIFLFTCDFFIDWSTSLPVFTDSFLDWLINWFIISTDYKQCWKMGKCTLNILWCSYRKIFKIWTFSTSCLWKV